MEKNYKEEYLSGQVDFDDLDAYIEKWGLEEDDPRTLREFLGLNAEEEDAWISIGDEALKELLDKQKKS